MWHKSYLEWQILFLTITEFLNKDYWYDCKLENIKIVPNSNGKMEMVNRKFVRNVHVSNVIIRCVAKKFPQNFRQINQTFEQLKILDLKMHLEM